MWAISRENYLDMEAPQLRKGDFKLCDFPVKASARTLRPQACTVCELGWRAFSRFSSH